MILTVLRNRDPFLLYVASVREVSIIALLGRNESRQRAMLGITNHSNGALALHLMPTVTDSESEGEASHNLTSSVALPAKATPTEENRSFKSQRQVNFPKVSATKRRGRSSRTS